jgi:hypothetical protein
MALSVLESHRKKKFWEELICLFLPMAMVAIVALSKDTAM